MYLKFLRKENILPCVILTLNNINYLFVRVYVWFCICINFNENPVNQKEAVLYSIKLRDYGENLKCHAHTFSEKLSSIKVCKKTLQLKCQNVTLTIFFSNVLSLPQRFDMWHLNGVVEAKNIRVSTRQLQSLNHNVLTRGFTFIVLR